MQCGLDTTHSAEQDSRLEIEVRQRSPLEICEQNGFCATSATRWAVEQSQALDNSLRGIQCLAFSPRC